MEARSAATADYALAAVIAKMNRNMRFVGWFNIIYGALISLSIIGAIMGVPLLISGLRLREAADEFEFYQRTGNYEAIVRGFDRQNRFFFIQKVFLIIAIVFMVLYIAAIIALIAMGVFSRGSDLLTA